MDSHANSEIQSIDWLEAAKHILAASTIVRAEKVLVLIKFDGERENGNIYTVDMDGNGNDLLDYRQETSDLYGAVSNAFPSVAATNEGEAKAVG